MLNSFLSDLAFKTNFKYAQIAKSILNYRLHLGGTLAENFFVESCNLMSSAENIVIKNPNMDNKYTSLKPVPPNDIVTLVNLGRSGTGLFHSLIDGHPEVSTLPSIYFSEFFDQETWQKIIVDGWNGMEDCFIAIYDVLFEASSPTGVAKRVASLIKI